MEHLQVIGNALSQIVEGHNVKEASNYLRQLLKTPDNIQLFIESLKVQHNPPVRQLIFVLLRRALVKHWLLFEPEFHSNLKAYLLTSLISEPLAFVRRSIGSVVASIAGISDWPELLVAVSDMSSNPETPIREVGLYVLSEMLDNERTYPALKPHFAAVAQLLMRSLVDPAHEVKKNALLCIGHLVNNIPDELGDVRPMLPALTTLVRECEGDEQIIAIAFELFANLLPKSDCILDWVKLALDIARNADLQLTSRESSSYFIECVIEDYPKLFTKNSALIQEIIQTVFTLAVECDDDPNESTPVDMAFRILDTVALYLPNKYVWSHSIAMINSLQADSNPRSKRAALIAAGVLAEGCSELLKESLDTLLQMLIPHLQDPRETVAEGAAIAIGYCAEHLRPDILDWHAEILPPLIQALVTDSQVVRRRAMFAMDAFVEACDDELVPYLDSLLKTIVGIVLHSSDKETIKTALGTLNTIIESAETRVLPYFNDLITLLVNLTSLDFQQHSSLVATALHTLGQLCDKCSAELFAPHLANSATLAFELLKSSDLELRESGFAFFYLAIPKNAASLSTFVKVLVEQALISVDRQATVAPEDSDDETEAELATTAFLDEKTAAMHLLGTIAVTYPATLSEFADHLLTALEVLCHETNESLRLESVLTYSQLMTACSQGNELTPISHKLWQDHCLPKYLEFLKEERSPRVVGRVLQYMHELLEQFGGQLLVPAGLEDTVSRLAVLIQGKAACQRDFEDEDEKDFQEELTNDLVTFLVILWKSCGSCLDALELLLLYLLEESQPNKPKKSRTLFIGCLADACLSIGSWKPAKLLNIALVSLDLKHVSLSRNSCYLIGAVCAVSNCSESYPQIIQALKPFLEFEPKTSNTRGLQDNAVAAVARMITAFPQYPLWPQVLNHWLNLLPLKEDEEEKPTILKAITALAEAIDLRPYAYKVLELCFDALLHGKPQAYPTAVIMKVKAIVLSFSSTEELQTLLASLSAEEQSLLNLRLS
mmetsp:Transcript_13604/g.25677  ORF Transcript_13604/g.25677 Transcript_13604/m.25677 type:complete len:1005 (-) Transcript_13604:18-3032(-)